MRVFSAGSRPQSERNVIGPVRFRTVRQHALCDSFRRVDFPGRTGAHTTAWFPRSGVTVRTGTRAMRYDEFSRDERGRDRRRVLAT